MLLKRHALDLIIGHIGVFRVIVLTGARQVGKSTLARMVLDRTPGTYLTLDDPVTLERATRDPDGLVASRDGLLVIDEVQRAPDLLRAIKLVVDRDPSPGNFLLTGSANLLGLRNVTESLAGRAIYLELLPLSWSEIVGAPCPTTIDDAFAADSAQDFLSTLRLPAVASATNAQERALAGGMPEAYALDASLRWRWYQSYRTTFLERDLRQLSEISNVPDFNRLTNLSLLRSGGLLNKSSLAVDAQLSRPTVDRYLNLLQVAYQIRLLQPYFANPTNRRACMRSTAELPPGRRTPSTGRRPLRALERGACWRPSPSRTSSPGTACRRGPATPSGAPAPELKLTSSSNAVTRSWRSSSRALRASDGATSADYAPCAVTSGRGSNSASSPIWAARHAR
jgi:predicted AAA+ superfamily ATPase